MTFRTKTITQKDWVPLASVRASVRASAEASATKRTKNLASRGKKPIVNNSNAKLVLAQASVAASALVMGRMLSSLSVAWSLLSVLLSLRLLLSF